MTISGQTKFANGIPSLPKIKPAERVKIIEISHRLGIEKQPIPEWLIATPKDKLPQPERLAFPPPPRGPGIWN